MTTPSRSCLQATPPFQPASVLASPHSARRSNRRRNTRITRRKSRYPRYHNAPARPPTTNAARISFSSAIAVWPVAGGSAPRTTSLQSRSLGQSNPKPARRRLRNGRRSSSSPGSAPRNSPMRCSGGRARRTFAKAGRRSVPICRMLPQCRNTLRLPAVRSMRISRRSSSSGPSGRACCGLAGAAVGCSNPASAQGCFPP